MDWAPLWHLAFREGLGPAALESSVFRVSFCGCVWRLGPTMPYLGTKQNREAADLGCREQGLAVEMPWAGYPVFQLSTSA